MCIYICAHGGKERETKLDLVNIFKTLPLYNCISDCTLIEGRWLK